jgi:hypothetical protein
MNKRTQIPAQPRRAILPSRPSALRFMLDLIVRAADEAPNRDSELALRDAAARIADAAAIERRDRSCGTFASSNQEAFI